MTKESPKAIIDRYVATLEAPHTTEEYGERCMEISNELRHIGTEVLKTLFDEIKQRHPLGGFGEGFYAGEIYGEIKNELERRKLISEWDFRDKIGEKAIELDGEIKAILTQVGTRPNEKWIVRSLRNGLRFGPGGKNRKEAILNANTVINRYGIDKVKTIVMLDDSRPWEVEANA